jgi:hypothetical protein
MMATAACETEYLARAIGFAVKKEPCALDLKQESGAWELLLIQKSRQLPRSSAAVGVTLVLAELSPIPTVTITGLENLLTSTCFP